jgi:ribosomal protein S18 acetylase RimI-like enzyme
MTVTTGDAAALVVLPHMSDHDRDVEIEIDDRRVVVGYPPERVTFTDRAEALQFVEMLCDGRVELEITHGLLWTTMRSYRDGLGIPFRRTRMPWPSVRPRIERRVVGFGSAPAPARATITRLDLRDDATAEAVLDLQRAAYSVEAQLIGSDGIPQLRETIEELRRASLDWIGIFDGTALVAGLAHANVVDVLDISRLVVSPGSMRRGLGEKLVRWAIDTVAHDKAVASTGAANAPALALYTKLGFDVVGQEEIVPGLTITHLERVRPR